MADKEETFTEIVDRLLDEVQPNPHKNKYYNTADIYNLIMAWENDCNVREDVRKRLLEEGKGMLEPIYQESHIKLRRGKMVVENSNVRFVNDPNGSYFVDSEGVLRPFDIITGTSDEEEKKKAESKSKDLFMEELRNMDSIIKGTRVLFSFCGNDRIATFISELENTVHEISKSNYTLWMQEQDDKDVYIISKYGYNTLFLFKSQFYDVTKETTPQQLFKMYNLPFTLK